MISAKAFAFKAHFTAEALRTQRNGKQKIKLLCDLCPSNERSE